MQKTETKKGKTQNMQECVNQKRRACFRMLICCINTQQTTYSRRRKQGTGSIAQEPGDRRQERGKKENNRQQATSRRLGSRILDSWMLLAEPETRGVAGSKEQQGKKGPRIASDASCSCFNLFILHPPLLSFPFFLVPCTKVVLNNHRRTIGCI